MAEYEDLESVYTCHRLLNNLTVFDNNILVTLDPQTLKYFEEWSNQKEQEWIAREEKLGTYDSAEIAVLKARGEILPFQKLLIPQYDDIVKQITDALKDSGSILNKEPTFIGAMESTR